MSLEPTTAYTRKHYGMHCACATTVDRLTAENARLRDALLPLVELAERVAGKLPSDTQLAYGLSAATDYANEARAALQEGQG